MLEVGRYYSAAEAAALCSVPSWKKRRLTKEYHNSDELCLCTPINFWEGSKKKNHKTFIESGLWAEMGYYPE